MTRLHIIKQEYPYNDKDNTLYIVNTEFIPRQGDLLVIDDALDGEDGSISINIIVDKVEFFYKMNKSYYGHNELDHVKIYI